MCSLAPFNINRDQSNTCSDVPVLADGQFQIIVRHICLAALVEGELRLWHPGKALQCPPDLPATNCGIIRIEVQNPGIPGQSSQINISVTPNTMVHSNPCKESSHKDLQLYTTLES